MSDHKNYITKNFPSDPLARSGWPWTVDFPALSNKMTDGTPWPKISIVTPSYNQAQFLEETIRSILLQGYPNLEYIIMDGGSDDESVEIIKKYSPWLTYWESEKDRGQSHALNKGFERATGTILGWINSDDYLLPKALETIALLYRSDPDAVAWAGGVQMINKTGRLIWKAQQKPGTSKDLANWAISAVIHQPGCFFSREVFLKTGPIREDLHYTMDRDLWRKLSDQGSFATTPEYIATNRLYIEAKTEGCRSDPFGTIEHLSNLYSEGDLETARAQIELFANHHSSNLPPGDFIKLCAKWMAIKVRDLYFRVVGKDY